MAKTLNASDQNQINEHPSGYLLMDTCCFLNYIEGKNSKAFDYDEIKEFLHERKLWLVITPYTLYECIQSCVTEGSLKLRGQAMLKVWDFWVLNINGLVGKDVSFEFGPDFVFSLNVGIGTSQEFVEKRNSFREKVYQSLVPRLTLLAQIIAVIYLLIKEYDENGQYPRGFDYRINLITGKYFQKEPNFSVQLYSFLKMHEGLDMKDGTLTKTMDAKDRLPDFIQDMVIQIIAVSKVIMEEQLAKENYDIGELNNRIFQEYYKTVGGYDRKQMVKQFKNYNNRNKIKINIDSLVDSALPDGDVVFNHLFKKVVTNWFTPGGQGKTLVNTLIDYVNLGVVERTGKAPLIYMTEDKPFIDLALSIDDDSIRATKAFYKKYYKKINAVRPI